MNFYFGYNQPLSGGILHYYLYRYSSQYGFFEEEDWEIPDDLFEEEDIKAAQDVPLFAQYCLGWITEDEFERRKEMLRRTLGITISEEESRKILEYHEEESQRRIQEYLIEWIPELQQHPKVQAAWPVLSHEELTTLNLEELKELHRAYRLTIQDQL